MASIAESRATMKAFALTVPGIVGSYTPAEFRAAAALGTVPTPCAITGLYLEEEEGFSTLGFQGGGASIDCRLRQWILVAPVIGEVDFTAQEDDIIDLFDAYVATLALNPMMIINGEPATHYPFEKVKHAFKRLVLAKVEYHIIRFEYPVGLNL